VKEEGIAHRRLFKVTVGNDFNINHLEAMNFSRINKDWNLVRDQVVGHPGQPCGVDFFEGKREGKTGHPSPG
jgi:hypothetical protein